MPKVVHTVTLDHTELTTLIQERAKAILGDKFTGGSKVHIQESYGPDEKPSGKYEAKITFEGNSK